MFLKRVYSEICVIRVQIFILVSLLCEFVTFRRKKRKKYSVVIYEQIRFCEIKSNLNPHALSWYAEKEKASLSQGGLQTKPSSSAQTAA